MKFPSFGSLIMPPALDYEGYIRRLKGLDEGVEDLFERGKAVELKEKLIPLFTQANALSKKYHVVVTNPPYHNKYNQEMREFILEHYQNYKADLYSAFIYQCTRMTLPYGYCGMMSPFTWMFIITHEKLRQHLISHHSFSSLIQLEYSAFKEATVPICTFVIQNQNKHTNGEYIRLTKFRGAELQPVKVREAILIHTRSDPSSGSLIQAKRRASAFLSICTATTRKLLPRCAWTTCRKCRSSTPTKSICSCSA